MKDNDEPFNLILLYNIVTVILLKLVFNFQYLKNVVSFMELPIRSLFVHTICYE